MKKLVTASILTMGLSISVFAADTTPVDTKGNETPVAFAGRSTCVIGNSTGTTAVLCASGSGVILQVIGSSVAVTDYLTFRDSATANKTSAVLTGISQANIPGVFVYPRFKNGLSVDASVAAPIGTGLWTVIYTNDLR